MAVDPIKIQTVLRKASDQQLMALLKRPDSIPSMFVQQEIRRRNQARQAAKADMSKMAMAQRPQLTPEMSRMDQPPMPSPQDPMASAIPMNTGGSGELAKQKQLLMQMYNAGRLNIVQGVAQNDRGELGEFARSLISANQMRPTDNKGLDISRKPQFTDFDMADPKNNFPGSRLNYSIAPMIQSRNTEFADAKAREKELENNKSEFLNQLEKSGIKAIGEEAITPEGDFFGVNPNMVIEKPEMNFATTLAEDLGMTAAQSASPFISKGGVRNINDFSELQKFKEFSQSDDSQTKLEDMLKLNRENQKLKNEIINQRELDKKLALNNILPSTVLDRRAIPRGPDFADQKFQQEKPSGMLETDAQLNIPIRSSTLSNIIDAFNNPVPDSDRFLATNKGDLDQARKLIQGEVGFGDISSTSGLEVPEGSGTLDIIGGIKALDKIVQDSKGQIPPELILQDNPSQTAIEQSLKDNFNYIKENLPELPKGGMLTSSDLIDKGILPEGLLAPTDDKAITTSDQNGQFDFVKKKKEKDTIEEAVKNTTDNVVDYTKPFTDKANMDNAFMDKDGKPLSAGDALKKQYQNLKESEAVNNDGKKTGGVGGAIASQYGALTDAQNKLIEAMKPNGGDRFWQLVAEFGANLAASDSPNFMQAAGQAMQQTLAEAKDMKKEDRQMLIDQAKVAVDLEFKRAELGLQLARINASSAKSGSGSIAYERLREQIRQNDIRNQNDLRKYIFDVNKERNAEKTKIANDFSIATPEEKKAAEDAIDLKYDTMIENATGLKASSPINSGGGGASTVNPEDPLGI